jgi:hypothetical protein
MKGLRLTEAGQVLHAHKVTKTAKIGQLSRTIFPLAHKKAPPTSGAFLWAATPPPPPPAPARPARTRWRAAASAAAPGAGCGVAAAGGPPGRACAGSRGRRGAFAKILSR